MDRTLPSQDDSIAMLRRLYSERIPLQRKLTEIDERIARLLSVDSCTRRKVDPVAERERRIRLVERYSR